MTRERVINYFSDEKKHHVLWAATLSMFVFLLVEKMMSGFSMLYEKGNVNFSFSMHVTDLLCVAVYLTMVVLISVNVRYKYLLIPDGVLFSVKLFIFASGLVRLATHRVNGELPELSVIEETVENLLFVSFLCVFFAGKLLKAERKNVDKIPIICLFVLLFSFVVTVGFEIVKITVEVEAYHYPTVVIAFNFLKGVLNEAFLDLPYILLTLLVYYTPKKH